MMSGEPGEGMIGMLSTDCTNSLIHDPVNKAKSVVLTDKGLAQAEDVFRALFARPEKSAD